MSDCFDPEYMQLVLPGRGRIAVTADSASRVLGLPNRGGQVKYEFDLNSIKFFNKEYGLERGIAPTIEKIAERVMKNKEADDDFFRSWLLLLVSIFLCPTTGLSISSRCYPFLVDLSAVKNLNWCQFVVDQLKFSALEGDKKNSMRGCLFFIVILYLDSLEVDTVEIPATEPRIAAWNWKLLDKVIKLDTNPDQTFGKLNLKRPNQCSSVIQNSLFHDVRRFFSSKVSKPMSNQKKNVSDAVAQFFAIVADAMGKFLEQSSYAGPSRAEPSSTQKQTRAKRARRSTARQNKKEDSEPNEDSDSSGDPDYAADSGHEHDDSDDSDGWDTDDKEERESFFGDGVDGMGDDSDNDIVVRDGTDEGIPEDVDKDGAVNKEGSKDGPAMTTSARITQDGYTDKGKSGPTAEAEEIDEQDNVTLITRLLMMKKGANADKRHVDDNALEPIAIEVISPVLGKDVTDDKASQPNALGGASAVLNKWITEKRRAKLKLAPKSVQGDEVHVHSSIGIKKSKSYDDLTASKSNGARQHIQRFNSLDFTPQRCDIMRFIDGDDANSQPDALANSNLGNNEAHIEVEPTSAGLYDILDGIDLDLVSKAEHEYYKAKLHDDISVQQQSSASKNPSVLQQDANANTSDQQDVSANRSVTPIYQPPPRRHKKMLAVLRSPFIDLARKKRFKCNKEVCWVYDVVCSSAPARRSTRSSSQSPSKDIIIVDYHEVYATLQEIADSVKPGGKLSNTVAEVGIFALQPMGIKAKKRVLPVRFATYLMEGQNERKEVNSLFESKRNHLDHRHLVMFPVLQEIQKKKDLEKVRHYFLLVLNLRNMRFEVLDSMRSLNDETLRVCCNTLVAGIKDLWKIHYSNSKKDIDSYEVIDIRVPIQNNTHDCGFHMLVHAKYWDGSSIANFTEKDMPTIRKVLTHKWCTHSENNADWKTLLNLH